MSYDIKSLSTDFIEDQIKHLQASVHRYAPENRQQIQDMILQYEEELDRRDAADPGVDSSVIDDYISDLISNFLYYDRKEDDVLPRGKIEDMVQTGKLTIDFMVESFRKHLTQGLKI